ncbi:MAG TPA: MDR family MFS transporter [Solirubrobacteraceae bacterium]|nr:MDR family MFS transporter [Solirubrobacteraceae bacterium]
MSSLPREVRTVAIVVIVGAIMSILDTTIVNVALETLARDLHSPLSTIQWVSTGYLLSLATVIPLTGWAAERFGPKHVWMTVVGLFVATSGLCGLAWSAESLIAFRVLQGLAGGMIMPIGMITLAQTAGPRRMGAVMSVVGVPMLLGPVLGPVIGGFIVTHLSWRWIFYVNLPIGLVGLALAARLLPAGRAEGRGGIAAGEVGLDWVGLLLLSPGVALIVFGLSEISTAGGISFVRILPVLVGLVMVALFVRHAWRCENPIVDIRLLRGRGFAAAAGTVFLVGAALFGALLLLPLYYQVARGESAFHAGLLMAPQGVGAALGMNRAGRLTDRVGGGRVVIAGLAMLMVGTIAFTQVGPGTSFWLLDGSLVLRGLGLGFTMMPAMAAAYATLENAGEVPRATPMLNVIQRVGGSLGTAVLAVILEHQISTQLAAAGLHGNGGDIGSVRAVPAAVRHRLAQPLATAFGHAYWWALAGTAIALVPAIVLAFAERASRRESAAAAQRASRTPSPIPG